MQYVPLGNSPIQVSRICLGTMTFGQQNTEAEAHEQLNTAFSRGVNFIDAAEMYPVPSRAETTGRTEQYVGSWLKRQARDKVIMATKATGPARSLNWIREGQLNFTPANLRRALEGSLKRLQTDYVDLYQLHWPDRNTPMFGGYHFDPEQERETVPLRETLKTLAEFIKEGKVRAWGPSNETPWGLMNYLRLADELGLPRPVSVQNAYSLLNRTWENGLAEIGYRERVSLLAYSPLGFGFLTGKYLKDPVRQAGPICSAISPSATRSPIRRRQWRPMWIWPSSTDSRPPNCHWPLSITAGVLVAPSSVPPAWRSCKRIWMPLMSLCPRKCYRPSNEFISNTLKLSLHLEHISS
jgi:aryl-alcohol dehydrogenase-like predicted oxidoreductase